MPQPLNISFLKHHDSLVGPTNLKLIKLRVSGEEWNLAIFNVKLRNARDEIDPAAAQDVSVRWTLREREIPAVNDVRV